MGAHVWVRDSSKQAGGKAYVSGQWNPLQQHDPPHKRVKRTWTRDATNAESAERPLHAQERPASRAAASNEGPSPSTASARTESVAKTAVAAVSQAESEIAKLRAALAAAERRKKEQTAQKLNAAELARAERKRRLESGFQQLYEAARQQAEADIKAQKARAGGASISFADAAEVERVLKASSDYAVLQLQPGVSASEAKKRYRQMAIALHPDKCATPQAGEAFHRLVSAYRSLAAYL